MCTKCGFRYAAPTGRACTVCAAGDGAQLPDDKSISSGQGPNLEGLDARDGAQRRQKAVSVVERVEKIEKDMSAMDGKMDWIFPYIYMSKQITDLYLSLVKCSLMVLRTSGT